ncbi:MULTISPECIES: TetR/AcrR family transcriptional regulator [Actinomycetes]|uniref:TetR/AcrR family transcriptional regulator n=2 Tax=Actinomycetes TaxID=1760 RepID=A0ABP6M109_9MICC|nr:MULTISPECIES: TetR/AcrR family transcriptional regulator [unclassified Nesterenkonia]MDS2173582.1 TetR/AcrR family transcriptional regulator [Nesterenkonia sp. CL21]OSM42958.1 TetR family transcriptional regulator [Nesterenkonia sp. PF2B19]
MTQDATTSEPSTPQRAKRMPREQRRRQLLDCALQVFVAKGYHAASMDDIADVAQVSKPVLYQHFPGKHELFLDLLDTHLAQLERMITEALGSTEDNKERVSATMTAFYEFISREDEAYRLLFTSGMDNDEAVETRMERFHDNVAAAIAEVIADDTGQPMAEATLLGHGLIGMITSAARHWSRLSERPDLDVSSQLTSRLAWRGISGFPKEPDAGTPAQ